MFRNSQNTIFRCFIFTTFFYFTIYDGLTSGKIFMILLLFYYLQKYFTFLLWVGGKRAEIPQKKMINLRWFDYGY